MYGILKSQGTNENILSWDSSKAVDLQFFMHWNRKACWLLDHLQQPFNSLAPRKFEWNFRHVTFKQILVIDSWGISCKIALIWMSQDFTDDQSTLVQVMAWCRQATSHYLSQCWPRSLSPYDVTRPQWVNTSSDYQAANMSTLFPCQYSQVPFIMWFNIFWFYRQVSNIRGTLVGN